MRYKFNAAQHDAAPVVAYRMRRNEIPPLGVPVALPYRRKEKLQANGHNQEWYFCYLEPGLHTVKPDAAQRQHSATYRGEQSYPSRAAAHKTQMQGLCLGTDKSVRSATVLQWD